MSHLNVAVDTVGVADATPDVTFVGRLATYRYYNMDQIVGQALATFRRIDAARAPRRSVRCTAPAGCAPGRWARGGR